MGRSARPLPACALLLAALVAVSTFARAQVPASGAPAAANPVAVRIDGVVAIVGGNTPTSDTDVILRSDVELRARLTRAADGGAAIRAPLSEAALAAALDALIAEAVVAREAARLHASPPSADQIEAQRAALVRGLGTDAEVAGWLASFGAEADELRATATRRAFVEAFLQANLRASATVSDAELARVHGSGEHPFTSMPLEQVAEPLRAWIAARALRQDVARWTAVLRGRTPVVVVVPFAPPPVGASEEERSDVGTGR
jgi:hypothetical protein